MRIVEVDVHDDDQLRGHWQVTKEADAADRPYAAFWSLRSATVAMRDPNNPFEQYPLMALDGADIVGTAQVTLPKLDNTHAAFLGLGVLPERRCRGVGSALLEAALKLVADHGRTTVMSEANLPLDAPVDVGGHFLERRGFKRASTELHRVLELPVSDDHLTGLGAKARSRRGQYRILTFGDRVPDKLLVGFCALQSAFNEQAPLGELDLEPEVWDEDRVRNNEARFAKQGRHRRAAMAVAPDGQCVALTELVTADMNAWQSGTLVLPAHRGHRLGLATKVANLLQFQHDFPRITMVHSWNAEENGPMVHINDDLGFHPVEYLVEMQRVL